MGAWIEIEWTLSRISFDSVAPLVGAWIEICVRCTIFSVKLVAPLVGAWIEISLTFRLLLNILRRSSRGSVD